MSAPTPPVSAETIANARVEGARSRRRGILLESLLGVIASLALFQFAAHFFISPYLWIDPPLSPENDSAALPFRPVKQVQEGISSAHITDTGARFTGSFLPGAPVYVVMGDSHVLARNVNDEEAMGYVAQKLARGAGHSINIRELGRSGGAPADFAAEAPAVLARWTPRLVFVVLSQRDFAVSLTKARAGEIVRTSAGIRIDRYAPRRDSKLKKLFWRVRNTNALTEVLLSTPVNLYDVFVNNSKRSDEGAAHAAAPAVDAAEVETAVAGLRQAFGRTLVVVYHPEIGTEGGEQPDARENALAAACRHAGAPFVSLRAALLAERRSGHFTHGFLNSRPGTGHLNAYGHRVAGEAIWEYIAQEDSR